MAKNKEYVYSIDLTIVVNKNKYLSTNSLKRNYYFFLNFNVFDIFFSSYLYLLAIWEFEIQILDTKW